MKTNMKNFRIINSSYLYPYALNEAFKRMCARGDLKEVKYVLTSSDLTLRPDIHYSEDYPFRVACQNNHLELVKYFIFQVGINRTFYINNFLSNNTYPEVEKLFEQRELNKTLQTELVINGSKKKVIKL